MKFEQKMTFKTMEKRDCSHCNNYHGYRLGQEVKDAVVYCNVETCSPDFTGKCKQCHGLLLQGDVGNPCWNCIAKQEEKEIQRQGLEEKRKELERQNTCQKCGGKLKQIRHKHKNAYQCQKCGKVWIRLTLDMTKLSERVQEGLKKAKDAGEKLPFGLEEVV